MTTYAEKVAKKKKLIEKHKSELTALLKNCPHDSLEEMSSYCSGTYYNKAYTTYWNECTVCHERFDLRTEEHSWFG